MTDQDRTKPPPGYILQERDWSTPHRPRWYAELDAYEGDRDGAIADAWDHYDQVTADATRQAADQREAEIVRRLAGELGEMEIGPTESIDDVVKHLHGISRWTSNLISDRAALEARLKELETSA